VSVPLSTAVRSTEAERQQAPRSKRLMRWVWRRLPRTSATFDLGKALTRSLLTPCRETCPVVVRFAGSVAMTLDLSAFTQNDLYCLDDRYEAATLRLWQRLVRCARTVLDVGSHVGAYGLVAAAANPSAQVCCVEASDEICRQLRAHALPYPNAHVVHAAIAAEAGEMWFCASQDNDGGGALRRDPHGPGCRRVRTQTLLQVCRDAGLRSVDVMKLDVEGLEHEILTRDAGFFRDHAPADIVAEIRIDSREPARAKALFDAMARRGYRARRVETLFAVPWFRDVDLANWHFSRPSHDGSHRDDSHMR